MESKLISIKTFAEKLDMSPHTIKKKWPQWCVQYGIRTKKIGRARRFYGPDVEKFILKGL